jgi:hypothetical protein
MMASGRRSSARQSAQSPRPGFGTGAAGGGSGAGAM